jgi:MSHA pilin protein MshD
MFIKRQVGMTMIELIIAIVIISTGLAGVMLAFSTVVKGSADPLIHKQMLTIAEEMMEEITLQPFEPNGAAPANSLRNCTSGLAVASRANFDDVRDFNAYQTTGICNTDGDALTELSAYSLRVDIDATASLGGLAGGNVIKITVIVWNATDTMQLVGWRTNYAQ